MRNLIPTLLSACLFPGLSVLAQEPPPGRSQDLLLKRQKHDRIEEMLKKENNELTDAYPHYFQCELLPINEGPWQKFPVIHIDRQGENILVDVEDLVESYLDEKLNKYKLCLLLRGIQKRYTDAGFTTTLISLDIEKLSRGELTLLVLWGRVSRVRVNGRQADTWRERFREQSLFSAELRDYPLNIHSIDQLIENLSNGLIYTKVQIKPDNVRPGYSIIDIALTEKSPTHTVSLEVPEIEDGQSVERKIKYTAMINGPFRSGDLASFSVAFGGRPSDKMRDDSISFSYSLPNGSRRYILSANASKVSRKNLNKYLLETTYLNVNLDMERVFHRTNTDVFTYLFGFKFTRRDVDYDLVRISISSEKYSEILASWKWKGHILDEVASSKINLHALFPASSFGAGSRIVDKLSGNMMWHSPINWLSPGGVYQLDLGWQYAWDPLPSNSQITIGDRSSFRASPANIVAGDKGVYVSNTLSKPILSKAFRFTVNFGLGIGKVSSFDNNRINTLVGLSGGIVMDAKSWHTTVAISYPLYASATRINSKSTSIDLMLTMTL